MQNKSKPWALLSNYGSGCVLHLGGSLLAQRLFFLTETRALTVHKTRGVSENVDKQRLLRGLGTNTSQLYPSRGEPLAEADIIALIK